MCPAPFRARQVWPGPHPEEDSGQRHEGRQGQAGWQRLVHGHERRPGSGVSGARSGGRPEEVGIYRCKWI